MGKNKTTAAFLSLFGGIFGIHKFYLNEAPAGIFYIFLFVMFSRFFPVTVLLGVVDAIRLFSMSTQEFDEKYNSGLSPRERRNRSRRGTPTRQRQTQRNRQVEYNRSKRKSRKPKSNPFKNSGLQKYKEYEMEGAIEDLKKALIVDDTDMEIYFTMACAHSLMENTDEAYKNLQIAVNLGFKDFDRINTEENLAFLRIHEDFDSFVENGYQSQKVHKLSQSQKDSANLLDEDVLLSQLNKLAELRKKGLLSEKEFEYERKKILRR